MHDGYDAVRRGLTNYERGLFFELGRVQIRGETQERGWVRQFAIRVGKNVRVLDSARTHGRGTSGVERKSGRINEEQTLRQLNTERAALASGVLAQSRWETVSGEKVPGSVLELMREMARDFPGRFHHEVLSRSDAIRAVRLGQSMVSRQLELIRPYELDRAERARQRLVKLREVSRLQEREDIGKQVTRHVSHTQRVERVSPEVRVAEETAPEKVHDMHEVADRERAAELARLEAWEMPPDVVKILGLGQALPPSAAVQERPGDALQVQRGGRSAGQERGREITRER